MWRRNVGAAIRRWQRRRDDRPRRVIGLAISSTRPVVEATLLAVRGFGLHIHTSVELRHRGPLPPDAFRLWQRFGGPCDTGPCDTGPCDTGPCDADLPSRPTDSNLVRFGEDSKAFARMIGELTEALADVACQTVARAGGRRDSILAAGVWDAPSGTGNSTSSQTQQDDYVPVCDAARLAEASELNVIDAFPSRDRAINGLGSPLSPLPYWILLGDWSTVRPDDRLAFKPQRSRGRWLLEFDGVARMIFLPPRLPLLTSSSQIAHHLFSGEFGAAPDRVAEWARQLMSVPSNAAGDSLLCSAAEASASEEWLQAIQHRLGERITLQPVTLPEITEDLSFEDGPPEEETFVSISDRRHHVSKGADITDGAGPDQWKAAAAAVLAMLHIDQTPANLTHLTGADAPRVLGRLTPGSPARWRNLLLEMAENNPQMLALRQAM